VDAPKKNTADTNIGKLLTSTPTRRSNENRIQSILNSDTGKQTILELDKINYKIVQLNSITDTIKGKYDLKRKKKRKLPNNKK
jgi:hypothetical protein